MFQQNASTYESKIESAVTKRLKAFQQDSTTAFRLFHGRADGIAGLYIDCFFPSGSSQISQATILISCAQKKINLEAVSQRLNQYFPVRSIYVRYLDAASGQAKEAPQLISGTATPELIVKENGLKFLIKPQEGYSSGLFMDQRENRQVLMSLVQSSMSVLNCFSYTCSFSVAAATRGALTTSLDLNKKFLEWGKENFELNQIDLKDHDFVFGDATVWLKKFSKQKREWDVIILDPPTFSRSRNGSVFKLARDYPTLVSYAAAMLRPNGKILCAHNQESLNRRTFQNLILKGAELARVSLKPSNALNKQRAPVDFPFHKEERKQVSFVWMEHV